MDATLTLTDGTKFIAINATLEPSTEGEWHALASADRLEGPPGAPDLYLIYSAGIMTTHPPLMMQFDGEPTVYTLYEPLMIEGTEPDYHRFRLFAKSVDPVI